MNILNDIKISFLPESILLIFIILNIILSLFINKYTYKISKIINITALLFVFVAMFFTQISPTYYAFNNCFISNTYTLAFKLMVLICGFIFLVSSNNLIKIKRQMSFEFFAILLTTILSGFSLISSNDFLCIFISMEILSISICFLIAYRKNEKSKEIALKYIITSIISSLLFLFGVSLIYGLTGNINIDLINITLKSGGINAFFVISSVLIIIGLMFKLACIPFHNWIIDVNEGADYNVCLYISIMPKTAAIALILKLYFYIFVYSPILQILTAIIAVISLFYSAIGAVKESNIKKIFAYSSIMHSSFILITTSLINLYAISSVIFYVIVYIIMNISIWLASYIHNMTYNSDNIEDYKGLYYQSPYYTITFVISLLSLAGFPPFSGFISKIYIFSALARQDIVYFILLLCVLIASVIGIFCYFKIIKNFFEKSKTIINVTGKFRKLKIILYVCTFLTVLIGIMPSALIKLSEIIANYI